MRRAHVLLAVTFAGVVGLAGGGHAHDPARSSGGSPGRAVFDYRNRSFDPATGRFLQRDPVLGGDPMLNPYCFPGNNPVSNMDPMGLWDEDGLKVAWDALSKSKGGRPNELLKKALSAGFAIVPLESDSGKARLDLKNRCILLAKYKPESLVDILFMRAQEPEDYEPEDLSNEDAAKALYACLEKNDSSLGSRAGYLFGGGLLSGGQKISANMWNAQETTYPSYLPFADVGGGPTSAEKAKELNRRAAESEIVSKEAGRQIQEVVQREAVWALGISLGIRLVGMGLEVREARLATEELEAARAARQARKAASKVWDVAPGQQRATVKAAFHDVPESVTLKEDLIVYRRWGGKSGETGSRWYSLTPYESANQARQSLALPASNTAERVSVFRIPKGTTVLRGQAASQTTAEGFGEYATGGGFQIYVPDPSVAVRVLVPGS